MNKKISIIGVNGKMGKWFANYFYKMGFEVIGFDTNDKIKEKFVIKANSLIGAILKTEYVLLCTPTKNTPEIIRLIAKEMKHGSQLIEISSQKSKTAHTLIKTPAKVNPVCIHPMFGPGIKKIDGKNIIIIPVKDVKKELDTAKLLFPKANFVTIDATEHDKKIAVILGLTHLINIAFANILAKDEKISLTEKMSGTTFKMQKIVTESILTESPELIETIISNPEMRKYGEEFWKDVGKLLTNSQEGKSEEIIDYIKSAQNKISKSTDLDKSYKKLSMMIKTIEKQKLYSTNIVTSFIKDDDKILILKRSDKVKSMKCLWAGVSGIIEKHDVTPLDRAKTEIFEETGIDETKIELLRSTEKIKIEAAQYKNHEWNIFPFLFKAKNPKIKLNWENSDYSWIKPNEIKNYETVPELEKILFSLL